MYRLHGFSNIWVVNTLSKDGNPLLEGLLIYNLLMWRDVSRTAPVIFCQKALIYLLLLEEIVKRASASSFSV